MTAASDDTSRIDGDSGWFSTGICVEDYSYENRIKTQWAEVSRRTMVTAVTTLTSGLVKLPFAAPSATSATLCISPGDGYDGEQGTNGEGTSRDDNHVRASPRCIVD